MGTIPAHVLVALLPVLLFKEDVCETSPPLSKPLPVSQSAGDREKKEKNYVRFLSETQTAFPIKVYKSKVLPSS